MPPSHMALKTSMSTAYRETSSIQTFKVTPSSTLLQRAPAARTLSSHASTVHGIGPPTMPTQSSRASPGGSQLPPGKMQDPNSPVQSHSSAQSPKSIPNPPSFHHQSHHSTSKVGIENPSPIFSPRELCISLTPTLGATPGCGDYKGLPDLCRMKMCDDSPEFRHG